MDHVGHLTTPPPIFTEVEYDAIMDALAHFLLSTPTPGTYLNTEDMMDAASDALDKLIAARSVDGATR